MSEKRELKNGEIVFSSITDKPCGAQIIAKTDSRANEPVRLPWEVK